MTTVHRRYASVEGRRHLLLKNELVALTEQTRPYLERTLTSWDHSTIGSYWLLAEGAGWLVLLSLRPVTREPTSLLRASMRVDLPPTTRVNRT